MSVQINESGSLLYHIAQLDISRISLQMGSKYRSKSCGCEKKYTLGFPVGVLFPRVLCSNSMCIVPLHTAFIRNGRVMRGVTDAKRCTPRDDFRGASFGSIGFRAGFRLLDPADFLGAERGLSRKFFVGPVKAGIFAKTEGLGHGDGLHPLRQEPLRFGNLLLHGKLEYARIHILFEDVADVGGGRKYRLRDFIDADMLVKMGVYVRDDGECQGIHRQLMRQGAPRAVCQNIYHFGQISAGEFMVFLRVVLLYKLNAFFADLNERLVHDSFQFCKTIIKTGEQLFRDFIRLKLNDETLVRHIGRQFDVVVSVGRDDAGTPFGEQIFFVIQYQCRVPLNDEKELVVLMAMIVEDAAGFAPLILEADMKMVTVHFDLHFRCSFLSFVKNIIYEFCNNCNRCSKFMSSISFIDLR